MGGQEEQGISGVHPGRSLSGQFAVAREYGGQGVDGGGAQFGQRPAASPQGQAGELGPAERLIIG